MVQKVKPDFGAFVSVAAIVQPNVEVDVALSTKVRSATTASWTMA
jgi:hypothetical protein